MKSKVVDLFGDGEMYLVPLEGELHAGANVLDYAQEAAGATPWMKKVQRMEVFETGTTLSAVGHRWHLCRFSGSGRKRRDGEHDQ